MTNNDFLSPEAVASRCIRETHLSLRELQAVTGINKSRLSDLRNEKGRHLSVQEAIRISEALDLPRSVFYPAEQSLTLSAGENTAATRFSQAISSAIQQKVDVFGHLLTTEALEAWYFATGGKLVEMPSITPHLTLFRAPSNDNDLPEVIDIGDRSLTADRVGTEKQRVAAYLGYLNEACPSTIASYRAAANQTQIETYYRRVAFRSADVPFVMHYKTVLMPTTDDGVRFIWNFSKCVSARPASDEELEDPSIPEGV